LEFGLGFVFPGKNPLAHDIVGPVGVRPVSELRSVPYAFFGNHFKGQVLFRTMQ